MRHIVPCDIIDHTEIAPEQWRMRLHAPDIAREARPGQFCMIQVADRYDPFLRRPMCFETIEGDTLSILYKVEGEGTRLLASKRVGDCVSVQGPLGKGFPIDPGFDRHIIVSGGIGVATFPGLAQALTTACGKPPEVVLAARTKDLLLCEDNFRALGCPVHLATDDGSAGDRAYAADMLARLEPGPGTRVYACGPMIMMETTSRVALEAGADCLVSLEAFMACGDGACLGCVVEANVEREGERMVRVCLDGPVFDTKLINWKAHNTAYDP